MKPPETHQQDGGLPLTTSDLLARGCSRCSLQGKCRAIRAATKEHFRWSIHNLLAHPASEIAWLLGMRKLSDWLHDKSIPKHLAGNGRG
jgi:hypothetical protein